MRVIIAQNIAQDVHHAMAACTKGKPDHL
jgi:hypothetical protein